VEDLRIAGWTFRTELFTKVHSDRRQTDIKLNKTCIV
jgi:hypothetical protein